MHRDVPAADRWHPQWLRPTARRGSRRRRRHGSRAPGIERRVRLNRSAAAGRRAYRVCQDHLGRHCRVHSPDDVCPCEAGSVARLGRSEAARAAFYNFAASAVRPQFSPDGGLPIGIGSDLREAMAFGNGGRTFSFYVPMLRVFRRIPPTTRPVIVPPSTPAEMRRVLEATHSRSVAGL